MILLFINQNVSYTTPANTSSGHLSEDIIISRHDFGNYKTGVISLNDSDRNKVIAFKR